MPLLWHLQVSKDRGFFYALSDLELCVRVLVFNVRIYLGPTNLVLSSCVIESDSTVNMAAPLWQVHVSHGQTCHMFDHMTLLDRLYVRQLERTPPPHSCMAG